MAPISLVQIHTASQGLTLAVTLACLAFFMVQRFKGKCNWEVMYVMVVQVITYIMLIAAGDSALRTFDDGQVFIWPRYMGWILTCPVIIELICQIAYKDPPAMIVSRYMMMTLAVLCLGTTASVFKTPAVKYTCVAFAAIILVFIYVFFINAWMSRKNLKPARMCLLLFFAFSWFIFPILFLLGPETSGYMSYHLSCFLHALADILCKNLFALFAWHFRQVKLPEMERRYAEAEDNKGVTMVGQLESGYSVVPSPAGAPLKFEMSQSSLAGAHPQQQMPDGTSALVLRMRELENRLAQQQLSQLQMLQQQQQQSAFQTVTGVNQHSGGSSPSASSTNLLQQAQAQPQPAPGSATPPLQAGVHRPGSPGNVSPEVWNRLQQLERRLTEM